MKAEAFGRYKKKGDISPFLPDFVAKHILDIDFKRLQRIGITHILLDLDQTIRLAGTRELEAEVSRAIATLNEARLFHSITLTTNNFWAKRYADVLGVKVFTPFWWYFRPIRKPSSRYFKKVLVTLKVKPHKIVMIGDKVHSDIVGANKAGMVTVLVQPRGRDYWFDKVLLTRRRERRSLNKARARLTD